MNVSTLTPMSQPIDSPAAPAGPHLVPQVPPGPPVRPVRPVRTAASLIVLRDSAQGPQVLMLRRAEKEADQNSGASVFPGGSVDTHVPAMHAACCGLDDAAASLRLAVSANGLDYYVAAVRECFEEAGL